MTLSNHFNFQAQTESAIKVSARRKSDGSIIHIRDGKIMSRFWPDGSTDKYGAEMRIKAKEKAAIEEAQRRCDQARMAQSLKQGPRVS